MPKLTWRRSRRRIKKKVEKPTQHGETAAKARQQAAIAQEVEPAVADKKPLTREELEAQDEAEAAAWPQVATWAEPPELSELTPAYWHDPEPQFHGMLTADRIRAYHYAVGRMIRPFQEEHLKPASYELTLGPRCLIDGKERTLTDDDPVLVIPSNSIVYVSMRETLLLPHWLVARFDLSIKFIYQGLLLGTGPQVDPGFKGVLSCPLHNISSRDIRLKFCEPFAKMDFVKTSWVHDVDAGHVPTEDALYEAAAAEQLVGYQGEPIKLWKRNKNFRPPIYFVPESREVNSSVKELDDRVKDYTRRVNLGGLGGVALAAALVAATIGVGAYGLQYVDGRVDDLRSDQPPEELKRDVEALQTQLETAREDLDRQSGELRRLRRQLSQLPGA